MARPGLTLASMRPLLPTQRVPRPANKLLLAHPAVPAKLCSSHMLYPRPHPAGRSRTSGPSLRACFTRVLVPPRPPSSAKRPKFRTTTLGHSPSFDPHYHLGPPPRSCAPASLQHTAAMRAAPALFLFTLGLLCSQVGRRGCAAGPPEPAMQHIRCRRTPYTLYTRPAYVSLTPPPARRRQAAVDISQPAQASFKDRKPGPHHASDRIIVKFKAASGQKAASRPKVVRLKAGADPQAAVAAYRKRRGGWVGGRAGGRGRSFGRAVQAACCASSARSRPGGAAGRPCMRRAAVPSRLQSTLFCGQTLQQHTQRAHQCLGVPALPYPASHYTPHPSFVCRCRVRRAGRGGARRRCAQRRRL